MLWLAVVLVSLQLAAVRVPPVLSGDDEGHGRREGPTREGEVSRGEGGGSFLNCVSMSRGEGGNVWILGHCGLPGVLQ